MNVAELLGHDIFNLPVSWVGYQYTNTQGQQTCTSYHQFVLQRLREYQELLAELDDIPVMGSPGLVTRVPFVSNAEEVRRAVRSLSIGIVKVLNAAANNNPRLAADELSIALEQSNAGQLLQAPRQLIYSETRSGQIFYRLRISNEPVRDAYRMFHLPFEERWKAGSYRFSVAGFPSMYAATTPLLALHELRAENFTENMYVSRLRAIYPPELVTREVRYLNLRNQVHEFRRRYQRSGPYTGEIIGFLVRWPLVMATSIQTAYPSLDKPDVKPSFNEEYVLPQMLVQWVNNNRGKQYKITGITYSSSRLSAQELTDFGEFNIVVPVEQPAARGLCAVRIQQFEITPPVALSEVLATAPNGQLPADTSRLIEAALASRPYQRLTIMPTANAEQATS